LSKAGNYAEALKRFQTALEVDPKNALAYRLEGESYFALGKTAEAVAAYRRALEYNPDWAKLKDWLDKYGDYYGKSGPANPPATP
jgi:Flp pilus assembly protein TadD